MDSEFETLTVNRRSSNMQRLISPLAPALLIAISYVDPGKWAAFAEGGARFGVDLVFLVFLFNVAAILCQYLSACIAIASGRDLAQICSEEYDKITCVFLGVQAEFSMIVLDLTMVLGTAHGLNAVFGIDLFTCVFLTIAAAFLFPLLAVALENGKTKCLCICLSSAVLFLYFSGVLISQPESSFSFSGVVMKVSGESAFVLMGLLGASIMPHNFYLHSSIVQQDRGPSYLSKEAVCYDHLFATVFIFSGIFLVNCVLMSLAANVFYSAGLVLVTFQDALSLLDQVYRSSLVPFALVLILFISNQIMALTWNLGRRSIIHDFFGMDIPGWLHYSTIRIIAIVPALCCVWVAGAEGIYQLLIFAQVLVALVLPSSVIPLFRVASSRSIMGASKISQFVEFTALVVFIGMIGLKIIFVIEMVFGNSEWASNLRWSMGSNVPIPYVIFLFVASISFGFMLWLAVTPLKSANFMLEARVWELQTPSPKAHPERYQHDVSESTHHLEKHTEGQEPVSKIEKSLDAHPEILLANDDINLPETLLDSENIFHLTTVGENKSEVTYSGSLMGHRELSTIEEKVFGATVSGEASEGVSLESDIVKSEPEYMVEKTLRIDGDMLNEKDGEGHSWEPEEPKKGMTENSQSLTSEAPGSFRSLGGKGDDVGSGTGSLSRLAGLGRAARRQLTVILDDFWGQLFDFHGQPTLEARAKKFDVLLGIDSKVDAKSSPPSVKFESKKDSAGYISSFDGRDFDSIKSTSLYNSPKQDTSYRVQQGSSSMWSNHVQLLDAYVRNSSHNTYDASERRYSSLRIPTSSEDYDQQPATVHDSNERRYSSMRIPASSNGYNQLPATVHDASERRYSSMRIPASSDGYKQQPATMQGREYASYVSQIDKERSANYLNGQIDLLAPQSTSSLVSNYGDSFSRSLAQKQRNGLTSRAPPGFHNVSVSRNSPLQSQRLSHDLNSPKASETTSNAVDVKKYYSLPDISGRHIPHVDSQFAGKGSQWDKSMGLSHSVSHSMYNSSTPLRVGSPLGLGQHSPSKVCRDAFSLQFNSSSGSGSLWSRQPFEQFGVAAKCSAANGERAGSNQSSGPDETSLTVDLEGKLIQSFRYCILRLLKLEGSDWLFKQNDGVDEDLIDRVAARERFHYEAETKQMNLPSNTDHHFSSERSGESDYTKPSISLTSPYCGEGCIYKVDLIVSFGVWCIHRILEFSILESRPELWGKYTYVLNRLQGIIDLAFFKSRPPLPPCFCLDIPLEWQQKSSTVTSNGSLPPPAKIAKGKFTTAAIMLELIKDVELAISCRKGRSGTAAGDVAFPKGKENLASVLKRYKRRLSNKSVGA